MLLQLAPKRTSRKQRQCSDGSSCTFDRLPTNLEYNLSCSTPSSKDLPKKDETEGLCEDLAVREEEVGCILTLLEKAFKFPLWTQDSHMIEGLRYGMATGLLPPNSDCTLPVSSRKKKWTEVCH